MIGAVDIATELIRAGADSTIRDESGVQANAISAICTNSDSIIAEEITSGDAVADVPRTNIQASSTAESEFEAGIQAGLVVEAKSYDVTHIGTSSATVIACEQSPTTHSKADIISPASIVDTAGVNTNRRLSRWNNPCQQA
jgi:hypothetical protein